MAGAIASGHGIASASPDASSNSAKPSPGAGGGNAASTSAAPTSGRPAVRQAQPTTPRTQNNRLGSQRPPTATPAAATDADAPTDSGSISDTAADTPTQPATVSGYKPSASSSKGRHRQWSEVDTAKSVPATTAVTTATKSATPATAVKNLAATAESVAKSLAPVAVVEVPAVAAVHTAASVETGPAPESFHRLVDEVLNWAGLGERGDAAPSPTAPLRSVVESLWLAVRQTHYPQAGQRPVATTTTSDPGPTASQATADPTSPAGAAGGETVPKDAVTTPSAGVDGTTSVEVKRETTLAEFNKSMGWIPVLGTVVNAFSLVGDLAALAVAALHADTVDIGDEVGDITRDLIGMVPVVGAPVAATLFGPVATASDEAVASSATLVSAAAVSATSDTNTLTAAAATDTGSSAAPMDTPEHFIITLNQILQQLVGWPVTPAPFVTPANYTLDQALDGFDVTLDRIFANPTPATQWLRGLSDIAGLFVRSAFPSWTFSQSINAIADLINRLVPPFRMDPSILGTITPTQVMGAAVGAVVQVLNCLANSDFDMHDIENAAIAGGTAGFLDPSSVLDMTFSFSPEPNPFSFMAYIVLVALYGRFKWLALDHLPVVSSVTQTTQLLGTVWGKVNATDPDGDLIAYAVATEPSKGIAAINADGTWSYTPTDANMWSQGGTDSFTVTLNDSLGSVGSLDHPYAPNGHSVTVTITVAYAGNGNTTPAVIAAPGLPDGMGVVRGNATGVDLNGDTLTYSLVNPGTSGATSTSIYTAQGGIVQINASTGAFTYIPKVSTAAIPAFNTDTFQIQVSDGHGGTGTTTVVVLSNLTADTSTTSVSAGVENGRINVPTADVGLLTYSLGTGPSQGTVVVNADGTYTYTRSSSATGSTSDSFTIIGTDANGKTVTLPTVSVSPPLASIATTTTVTGGTFVPRGMVGGIALTPGTQTTTGTFSASDASGTAATVAMGIYSTADGGTVTVLSGGGFLYTNTSYSDIWHRAAAVNATAADQADTVKINVTSASGVTTEVTFSIALRTENSGPSSSTSVGSADSLGIVRGSVSGSDSDGDSLGFSLAGVGNPTGATANSTYTANGGMVTLNSDGTFVYTPTKSSATTDSFKVLVSDGHGGTTTATVNVPLSTPSPVTNINTSTPSQVTGNLNVPAADSGLLTYSVGTAPSKGTVTVNADGSFTYVRTSTLGHTTTPPDSFTIAATDANGKTVIIATVNVTPVVANTAPAPGTTTFNSSTLVQDTVLGIGTGNYTQTTTGTLTSTDADGDTVTYTAGSYSTTNGGTVTINANGTFSYTVDKAGSYYHGAAQVGASGINVADTFTATVSDAFGGSTTYIVAVPIYAQNSAPTLSGGISWAGSSLLGTYGYYTSVYASDGDNDSFTYSVSTTAGTASYNATLQTLSTSGSANGTVVTLTVYDGYYVVVNGVVTSTLSSYSKTYTISRV
jgi:VCBS repeat-containing protein